jgi:hypothetical protein
MIESIHIKNFRGIQTGQIDGFRKFNLLVGPNNSGKSAVLEALYLASTANRKAHLGIPPVGYDVKIPDRDFLGDDPMARVCARHNYAEPPSPSNQGKLSVNINNSASPLRTFNLSDRGATQGKEPNVALFSIETGQIVKDITPDPKQPLPAFVKWLFGDEVNNPEFFVERRLAYCWSPELTYNKLGSAAWVVKSRPTSPQQTPNVWSVPGNKDKAANDQLSPTQQTLFYDVSNTLGHLPMDFFRRMIVTIPGWSQKIARAFGQVLGLDTPFNVQFLPVDQTQQWTQGWIAPEDQIALTIDSYGHGARSIFKVLTPLLALAELARDDAPGLFIWEEPELFQNPQTLGQLLTEVARLLKGKPIQLFIATHSLEVVAHFVRLVKEGIIAEEEMAAVRLNLTNGQLSSSVFNHRDIQDWTEMNLDLRVPSGKVDSPLTYQLSETVNATDHD